MTALSGNWLRLKLGGVASQVPTSAWEAAVLLAGGTFGPTMRSLANTFFEQMNNAGILLKADDIWCAVTEQSVAANVSMLQLRTVTPHNNPPFISWRGVGTDGVSQYEDSNFIPVTHCVFATGTSFRVAIRAQTNAAQLTTAVASYSGGAKNMVLYPRTTVDEVNANMNSTAILTAVGAITDTRQLVGVQREGSIYTVDVGGVDIATTTPGTQLGVLSNVTTLFGASPSPITSFWAGIRGFVYVGAPLSDSQKAVFAASCEQWIAAAQLLVDPNVYVSSVNFGGVPIGNDSNPGTSASPVLTLSRGIFGLIPNGLLHVNGDSGSPPTYTTGSDWIVNYGATIETINSRGAFLAGYYSTPSNTHVMQIGPPAGETVTLAGGIFDATKNALGPTVYVLELLTETVPYSLVLTDVAIQGQSTTGLGIHNRDVNLKVNLTITNSNLIGGSTRGNVDLRDLIGGTITISGGSSVITNSLLSGFAAHLYWADTSGMTATMTNHNVSVTADAAFSGASISGTIFINIPTVIDGGTHAIVSALATPSGLPITIHQGTLTDTYQFPIDGSIIRNVTASNNSPGGGIGLEIGVDNANQALANNCVIHDSTFTGTVDFANGDGHGVFMCCTTNSSCNNTTISFAGLGMVDKSNINFSSSGLILSSCLNAYILLKGSVNSTHTGATCTAGAGYPGVMVHIEDGQDNTAGVHSSGTLVNCSFTVAGATGVQFILVEPLNTLVAMTGCTFTLTSGSLATHPVTVNGVNYDTGAAFMLAFPGNLAVGW